MDEHRPTEPEQRLAALERTVQDPQAVVERQARHIDSIERAQAATPGGTTAAAVEGASPSAAPLAEPAGRRPIDRRRLLLGGATAAAATAAAAIGAATPAAAADGDPIVLGTENTSSNMTTITAPLDGFPVINVVNEGTGAALQGSNTSTTIPAIRGIGTGSAGVYGESPSNEGVLGTSTSGTGVYGQSTSGAGVDGRSINSAGVFGLSSNDFGVAGVSSTSAGVRGGGATGLLGVGTKANLSIRRGSAVPRPRAMRSRTRLAMS